MLTSPQHRVEDMSLVRVLLPRGERESSVSRVEGFQGEMASYESSFWSSIVVEILVSIQWTTLPLRKIVSLLLVSPRCFEVLLTSK